MMHGAYNVKLKNVYLLIHLKKLLVAHANIYVMSNGTMKSE